jgi:hypothetical protein
MHTYIYSNIYTHLSIPISTPTSIHLYLHLYLNVYRYIYTYIYIYIYISSYLLCLGWWRRLRSAGPQTQSHGPEYSQSDIYMDIYVYICICIYVYQYKHMHAYIHTHIHTSTQTCLYIIYMYAYMHKYECMHTYLLYDSVQAFVSAVYLNTHAHQTDPTISHKAIYTYIYIFIFKVYVYIHEVQTWMRSVGVYRFIQIRIDMCCNKCIQTCIALHCMALQFNATCGCGSLTGLGRLRTGCCCN